MEDRHVEIGNLEALFGIETTEPTSFYAVYDGHAGSAAAMYCAAHLHQYLVESPYFTTDLRRALRDAFLKTDTEFVRKSNQERACGGSTAVAVTVRGRKLLAAWAGDSLALLAKRMRLMQLVRAHKPHRQDERDRIEQSGGTVMYWGTWRVNGQLAVSRAIGDAQYKPYVTARPETATVDLDGDEDFVVVACDGLWDFVSEDDVALSVYRQIASDPVACDGLWDFVSEDDVVLSVYRQIASDPVDLDGDEDFVVVACDGLWDFVSEDDVALSVYRQIASDPDTKASYRACDGLWDFVSEDDVALSVYRQIASDPVTYIQANVTAQPETATVDLDGDEDFVVVACGGLWDFVSEDDVALSVYRQIASDPGTWQRLHTRLLRYEDFVVVACDELWNIVSEDDVALSVYRQIASDPVDLDGDEDFVVVACNGLWDFVSEDDVALSVYTVQTDSFRPRYVADV
ncbi:protein phosphatase 2C domain-containing protein [Phthorimaea operculella]|nr:protein phosphatase 2C domain-containing protein [Phthorimaea operculella]